jgi:hypothetical protein
MPAIFPPEKAKPSSCPVPRARADPGGFGLAVVARVGRWHESIILCDRQGLLDCNIFIGTLGYCCLKPRHSAPAKGAPGKAAAAVQTGCAAAAWLNAAVGRSLEADLAITFGRWDVHHGGRNHIPLLLNGMKLQGAAEWRHVLGSRRLLGRPCRGERFGSWPVTRNWYVSSQWPLCNYY